MKEIRAEAQPVQEAAVGAVGGREQSSSTATKVKTVKTQPIVARKESELLDIINQLKGEIAEIKRDIHESHRHLPSTVQVGNGAVGIVRTAIEESSVTIASNVDKVVICPGDVGPGGIPQTGQSR